MKESLYHVIVFGVPRAKVLPLIDKLLDEGKRVSVVRAKSKSPKSPTANFDPKPYFGQNRQGYNTGGDGGSHE